ncbi:hypothetical protein ADICYQ_5912 [Cyclobacterium qasimii M12-11B]|uniref:Uncharacterized protein n=2 Tax=Cyclobacterium qasimii TaxID=1350429 RepID=S7V672_9BACT|nr:hypothetical protein ADICYQ_5912 [Cyclobacterium qasimii M12-11B]GEO23932.1 hypothetical protein CQA01_44660 [Cyclobacterium qasimii]
MFHVGFYFKAEIGLCLQIIKIDPKIQTNNGLNKGNCKKAYAIIGQKLPKP